MKKNLLETGFHKTCSTPEEAALVNLIIMENNLTCEESEHSDETGIRKARFHFDKDTFEQYAEMEAATHGKLETDQRFMTQLKGDQTHRYHWVGKEHRKPKPSSNSL
jgi:hypothetical protein